MLQWLSSYSHKHLFERVKDFCGRAESDFSVKPFHKVLVWDWVMNPHDRPETEQGHCHTHTQVDFLFLPLSYTHCMQKPVAFSADSAISTKKINNNNAIAMAFLQQQWSTQPVHLGVYVCLRLLDGRRKMGKQKQWQGIKFTLCNAAWVPGGVQQQKARQCCVLTVGL